MQSPLQTYLDDLHRQLSTLETGHLADYIPELAKADPRLFGICLVTVDGTVYGAGDTDQPFTIQSISKALVYAAALADQGKERVGQKVGVEPSGEAFNSISLHPQTGAPLNPMINAGAIATTSLVHGDSVDRQWARIQQVMDAFAGHPLQVDDAVCHSESATGHRNRGIAWMLKNFGIIEGDPMACVENYFRQCSLLVSCQDIAMMAATLANQGRHPLTGQQVVPAEHVQGVLSVMATCGMYNYAGSWMTEVGLPAKSGVGGGILAVLPGRFGIGVFSPLLDDRGNSVRGIQVCQRLSRDFGFNVFGSAAHPRMALGNVVSGADAPSRRQPTRDVSAHLKERSQQIQCLNLHGFLGVDGAEYVIRQMLRLAEKSTCFILDMHRVDGLSEAAARLFNQTRIGLAAEGVAVVFSRIHNRPEISGPLRKSVQRDDRGYLSFEDNDLAMEWCENRLLEGVPREENLTMPLSSATLFQGLPAHLLEQVLASSQTRLYPAGACMLARGAASDGCLFFIECGQASVLVPLPDGAHQRIATLGPGMVFGEMVLLGQTSRSASVMADTELRCVVIQAEELDRISSREPCLKITLLENLASDMADKLRGMHRWVAALA